MHARYPRAGDILNNVALEVGLTPARAPDPYSVDAQVFAQMRQILNVAGTELTEMYDWQIMVRRHEINTKSTDSGIYDLPIDYQSMINQSGWEHTNRRPLEGPLTAQEWAYFQGRDLVTSTLYPMFRIQNDKFTLYPNDPVTDGLEIHYEYQSSAWVEDSANPGTYLDEPGKAADVVLFPKNLITRYLKLKWLLAKQLNATSAQSDFDDCFDTWKSKDKGSRVANLAPITGTGLINRRLNIGDSGYGV